MNEEQNNTIAPPAEAELLQKDDTPPDTITDEETSATAAEPADNKAEENDSPIEIVGVGFRTAGKSYYFSPRGYQLERGTSVIVETARGVEMGKVTIPNKLVPKSEVISPLRDIIRPATPADISRNEENRRLEVRAAEICKQKIQSHKLNMNLVSVEYTFDNSKLLFYFTAESRVDFRELVKDLAGVFKTRIELRQIGIRDEAKLMGGFGVCGRPFCCSSFLSDFVQVSIKMAKEQNFSLNSAKISGACGRLMCCLRYEHDAYEEAIKNTPSTGSVVSTPNGLGTVIESRPLLSTVKVRLDEKPENTKLFAVKDVKVIRSRGKSGLQPEEGAEELLKETAQEIPAFTVSDGKKTQQQPKGERKNTPRGNMNGEAKNERNRRRGGDRTQKATPESSNAPADYPEKKRE